MRLLTLLTLPVLFAAGCVPQQACTTIAVASVNVTVVDGADMPIPGVEVVYDAGDGELPCDAIDETTFVCGYEVDGEISVTARAVGYMEQSETVTVGMTEDLCHVVGEMVTLALPPEAIAG